jgi:hypothetical protein
LPSIASLQNAEKYSGKPGEDLKGFVKTMKIYLSAMGGSEAEKLLFLGSKLEGPARSVYNRFTRGSETATVNEVLQELLDSFGSQMNKHHAKEIMLQRQKLPGETMTMYLMAKWDLITDAGIETPAKVNYYLLEGLNKPELITRYANSMEENTKDLIRKLETEERVTRKMSRSKRVPSSPPDIKSQIAANFGGEDISVKKIETPSIETGTRERAADGAHPDLVHIQRMIDGLKENFDKKMEKMEKKYQPDKGNRRTPSRREPCQTCGKIGHETANCWHRSRDGHVQGHREYQTSDHPHSQPHSHPQGRNEPHRNFSSARTSGREYSSHGPRQGQHPSGWQQPREAPNQNNSRTLKCWGCGGPHPQRMCRNQGFSKNENMEGGRRQ